MWTAKRPLILVAGLLVSLCGYAVYGVFLGDLDGVQPIGSHQLENPTDDGPEPPIKPETDRRLELAFGAGCKELQRPLRLWLPDKGIAFAAGAFDIDKSTGKVHLAPFSAAFYHKSKVPGEHPEISTIRANVAILTLDKQVTQFSELNGCKIIAVEMIGGQPGITLTNNRRTAEKNDDVDVLITNGSLIYVEARDLIYTEGIVCLTDHQSKPPMQIRGKGLKMHLAKDSGPNRPKNAKPRPANQNNDNGNIEKIELASDVDMFFWTDAKAGFLGGTPNAKKVAEVPAEPAAKARIHIRTGGPFVYDLTKEFAWFESPPTRTPKVEGEAFAPDQVHVTRTQTVNGKQSFDQLTCDRLDLQFRRRAEPAPPPPGGEGSDKEIETAKATRRDVNEVVLALDSEGMAAFGNEMFYRAGDAANGPLTILVGTPLRTAKDGHKMVCKELHMFGANRVGEGQKGWAKGPGQIDMLDSKNPDKQVFPTHVIWRDTLTVVTEKEGGEVFDLTTVEGEASFIDDLQKQQLHGEIIKVWMRKTQEGAKKPEAVGGARQEIHRVYAQDKVRASAPEYIVRRTNRLTMMFLPEMPRDAVLPDLPSPIEKKDPPLPGVTIDVKAPIKDNDLKPIQPKTPIEEKKKPAPPIELEGNEISVAISTLGEKKEVQELISKGAVHVFQAGDKPGEKRLDITGTLLTVKHAVKGHTMIVYGEKTKLAKLEIGDSIIWGPIVTVNQADNWAQVDGLGAMEMPSSKNIDGTETTKKSSRITIDWKSKMTFDGRYAIFYGGVQARENGTYNRALCEELHAKLDKHISFMEGQKNDENAKIDKLIFNKNVYIQEYRFDEKKEPLQYNKLQGAVLTNLDDGPTNITGPGWIRLLAKGAAEQAIGPAPAAPKNAGPARLEWKLTHVKFRDGMTSVPLSDGKKATFYGSSSGVEVFHFPTVKIDDTMDPDRPVKDGLYLRCDTLTVTSKQEGDRNIQTMIAKTNVYFRTDKHLGYADIVKYDEANDRVIFESTSGRPVQLYKMDGVQPVPASMNSNKVLYNRKTGEISAGDVKSLTN